MVGDILKKSAATLMLARLVLTLILLAIFIFISEALALELIRGVAGATVAVGVAGGTPTGLALTGTLASAPEEVDGSILMLLLTTSENGLSGSAKVGVVLVWSKKLDAPGASQLAKKSSISCIYGRPHAHASAHPDTKCI